MDLKAIFNDSSGALQSQKVMQRLSKKYLIHNLGQVGNKQLIGEEDVSNQRQFYQNTVKCISKTGTLIYIRKEDFSKL